MAHVFVIDTVSFINYHNDFFDEHRMLSKKASEIIDKCLSADFTDYKLIIPSIVLVEIFEKQLRNDEKAELFRYTILKPLLDNEHVEIKSIEQEVIQIFCNIDDEIVKLENHDKLILSAALQMKAPIITKDGDIRSYLNKTREIEHMF